MRPAGALEVWCRPRSFAARDIDTLTALEDLLDSWPGTLVVVSHDRYFVERLATRIIEIGHGRAEFGGEILPGADAADRPA